MRGITKRFPGVVANDHVDFDLRVGEIHALLGENGAGKSTLMNVLYGLYDPDGGEILVDGTPVTFAGPGDAMAAGIGMVHQHFMLVPVFTVAENVVLGHEPVRGRAGLLDLAGARRLVREISDRFGFAVDPDALVEDLPVGVQQRVEIIKALSHDAKVLILDEPTAVLTPQEIDELMDIMRSLKEQGTSIQPAERSPGRLHPEHHVVGDREDGDEHEVLVHHADTGGDRVAGTAEGNRLVVDEDLALVRLVEAVQDVHQRRLAGAVLPEQAVDLAGLDRQVDVVVRGERAEPAGQALHLELLCSPQPGTAPGDPRVRSCRWCSDHGKRPGRL